MQDLIALLVALGGGRREISEFILVFITGLVALAFIIAIGLGLIWAMYR